MISNNRPRDGALPRRPRQAVAEPPLSRVVPKPVPRSQAQDARIYQIEQLRRRYSPRETPRENGDSSLLFSLTPSDPDFPFELAHLECDLLVPAAYPKRAPQLQIRNKDIPRGFSINIEKGWDRLVQEKRGATLLALTNALDRRLEQLLSEQKSETVKMTIFKDTRHQASKVMPDVPQTAPATPHAAPRRYIPEESYTREQVAEAKARRAQETRQLEARMGRLDGYSKSSDGVVYTLPLEPRRRTELPQGLQPARSVQLIVPLLYPLQPLRILLNDVESKDAEGVEGLFAEKASEQKHMTLMGHVNFLAQSIHTLAKQAQPSVSEKAPHTQGIAAADEEDAKPLQTGQGAGAGEGDRPHVQVIPRPPEWCSGGESDSSSESAPEDSDQSDDEGEAVGEGQGLAEQPLSTPAGQTAERGTALTFPSVELRGVELLHISVLGLGVKCGRCKTVNEMHDLRGGIEKAGSCRKCTSSFAVRFRPEIVHLNSTRAGFIDAEACTVAALLPSTFIPTCTSCSTPSSGLVAARGDSTTNVCRECHGRFTFKLPEVKFLAYAPGAHGLRLPAAGTRRGQERERLGKAGEELPDRGACAHYRRSHRWFRFSCCGRVHPCDRCHDAAEDHTNEWATRMVCGWCSREQRYQPESCAFCGRSVIGRRGKGYWEGGKGTRNRVLMRRGDKRKHRRVGGGEAAKAREQG